MSQLYCGHTPKPGEEIIIDGDDFHHIMHVRRHSVGDTIFLRTQEALSVKTTLSATTQMSLTLTVESIEPPSGGEYTLILAMPVLKGKKNDLVIEKGVEAGVTSFIPVFYERSIPDKSHAEKKCQRWQKIAHEAYKQSNALFRAQVVPHVDSKTLFSSSHHCNTALICDVHEKQILKPDMLSTSVICAVGPEGGFTSRELEWAVAGGWNSVALMTNQLRAESAAIIIPAMVRHFMFL